MMDFGLQKAIQTVVEKSKSGFLDLISAFLPKETSHSNNENRNDGQKKDLKIQIRSRTLQSRKKRLLQELTTIDTELKHVKVEREKFYSHKKTESEADNPQLFKKAADLVARMNQKRREQKQKELKKEKNISLKIQKSLKEFKQIEQKQNQEKEQKRLKIEERIQNRKDKLKLIQDFSKKSNFLVQQLQNFRTSLPNINRFHNPQQLTEVGQRQQNGTQLDKKPKFYPKSPFLQRIQQEQMNRRRQEYIKSHEKKKIRERQQIYGKNVRIRLKESSLFVTD